MERSDSARVPSRQEDAQSVKFSHERTGFLGRAGGTRARKWHFNAQLAIIVPRMLAKLSPVNQKINMQSVINRSTLSECARLANWQRRMMRYLGLHEF